MSHRATDAKSIFQQALEQEPNARATFLTEACGDNDELRQRVEALLRAHNDAGSFLDEPALQFPATQRIPAQDDKKGDAEQPLDFLKPCDKPDRIGMLGHYEIVELVGRGGMGIVLRAADPKLNRVVAIKVLAPELASNPEACKRFLREGQAAAAINHDHVVTIYGIDIDDSGRLPFIVMEYVLGQSLQQRIDQTESLGLKEILRIGKQAASGLAAAHDEGLVHRDIKPANILLENGVDRVKITDFGLARAVDDVSITRSGTVAGTPQYMSPEQARGDSVDHRSDLFSLGGALYAMCSGRAPFQADSTVAMIRRVCDDEPQSLQQVNPEVPDWLVAIVDRLLEKDREVRLQSAMEVADLLGRHLLHLQQPGVNPQPPSVGRGTRHSSVLTRAWASRRAWFTGAAATLLLAIGLGAAEYSGVTQVTGIVIRALWGEGTLVIEVDDPSIEVEVVGQELVIRGAGMREFRVQPGQHTILARKDGKTIYSELVSITRDGREIVQVRIEPRSPRMVARPVLRDVVDWTFSGQPSPRGDYVSYVDLETWNLGVHELATGTNRLLTNTNWPQQASYSIFSPDGTQIAYQFFNQKFGELRIVGLDGAVPRTLFGREDIGVVKPAAWSPDGNHILALVIIGFGEIEDQKRQLALISVRDRTASFLQTRQDVPALPMSFSPDGNYIAYSHGQRSGMERHLDVSVLAIKEEIETVVIEHPANDLVMGWTHDGNCLVFASDRTDSMHAYTIPIAGAEPQGEPEMATPLGKFSPMGFTKDGSYYYGRRLPGNDIYTATIDFETGDVVKQPVRAFQLHEGHQSAPDWSPDGKSLACRSGPSRGCLIRSSETGETRELLPELDGKGTQSFHSLRWSPDGSSFLFAGVFNLLLVGAESGAVTEIMHGRRVFDADWSHDGKVVFYVDTPESGEPHRIVRHQLDGGTEKELSRIAEHVLWLTVSPDGERLALLTETEGDERAVKLVPATGGEPQDLIKVEGITRGALAWTIDGRYLLYGLGEKNTELWRVAVEGGMRQKLGLKVTGQMRHLRVHPDGKQIAFNVSSGRSELWVMENFLASLAAEP